MAIKPFEIQSPSLVLAGVQMQAGATGVVIPGVTQATSYSVEEVNDTADQTTTWGTIPTVIDNGRYEILNGAPEPAGYAISEYIVEELDGDQYITEIQVDTAGSFPVSYQATVTQNMWATTVADPFTSFNPSDWTQIPFAPQVRAGEIENIGGANTGDVTFNNATVQGNGILALAPSPDATANLKYLQIRAGDTDSHIHFDSGDNSVYDIIVGDDSKFTQVSSTGNIIMRSYDSSNSTGYTLTLDNTGDLIVPGTMRSVGGFEYNGFYASVNQISGNDPSINQIILSRSSSMVGSNGSTNTNDDTFGVAGLGTSSTVAAINLYGSSDVNPIPLGDIQNFVHVYIDQVLYNGGTLRTSISDIQDAFTSAQSNLINSMPANTLQANVNFRGIQSIFDTSGFTTSGEGTGAVFFFDTDDRANGLDKDYAMIGWNNNRVVIPGTGYMVNDTIIVPGLSLGGVQPADNMTITVMSVDGAGGIVDFSVSGTMTAASYAACYVKYYIYDGTNDIYDTGNFYGTNRSECVFTATVNSNGELVVSSVASGALYPFMTFFEPTDTGWTMVLWQKAGTEGGAGTYICRSLTPNRSEATYTANRMLYAVDQNISGADYWGVDSFYGSMLNNDVGILSLVAVNCDVTEFSYLGETGSDGAGAKTLTPQFAIGTPENLTLASGYSTWTFGSTGNITLPQGSVISENTVGNILGTSVSVLSSFTSPNIYATSALLATDIKTNLTNFNWSANITGITLGTTTYVDLDRNVFGDPWSGSVTITGVNGTSEINATWGYQASDNNTFVLYTDTTFSTQVDSSAWGAYINGGVAYTTDYRNININASNVNITSQKGDAGTYQWSFGYDGNLTVPARIKGASNYNQPSFITPNGNDSNWSYGIYNDGGSNFWMQSQFFGQNQATRGFRVLESEGNTVVFSVDGTGNSRFAGNIIGTGASPSPYISGFSSINTNEGANLGNFVFGSGNLTLPGNTFSVYYANGTQVSLGGGSSYGDSNVVTLLGSYGTNSISTGGTITANSITLLNSDNFNQITFSNDGTTDNGHIKVDGGKNMVILANSNFYVKQLSSDRLSITDTNSILSAASNVLIKSNGTTNIWNFDTTGNLTLPANSIAINYNNGTAIFGNIVSVNKDGSSSNVLYGNGVFAAVSSPASIANGTSNVTIATAAGNVVTNVGGAMATTVSASGIQVGGLGRLLSPGGAVAITLDNNGFSASQANLSSKLNLTGNANISGVSATGIGAINAGNYTAQLANTVASFTSNVNSYTQVTNQNKSTGTAATSDFILTADNGSDTVNYGDFGVINSGYNNATPTNSLGNIVYAADTYLYAQGNVSNTSQSGGNLAIGTTIAGKNVKIFAGGVDSTAIVANIANTGVTITGNVTASGTSYANNNIVIGSNTSEGGQLVLGYVGINGISGQANSTWNVDVDGSNNFRIFTQYANGSASTPITVYSANSNVNFPANITANTNGYAIGYLNIPQVAASNTTLGLTDAGKHYYSTTVGNLVLTIPNNATTSFATGTAISIVVQAAGNILVNAASGVTLYMAGNSTSANRVVGTYGMATLMKVASDTWFINGTGVS